MKKFELHRVNVETEKDYLEKMSEMKKNLEAFLEQPFDVNDKKWKEQFQIIIDHQSGDGSFRVINTTDVHGGPSFDFVIYPTIIGAAILMKAILLYPERFERFLNRLEMALNAFAISYTVPEAAEILSEYGLWGLFYKYPKLGSAFQEELWKLEDCERFFKRRIFTYGSLMRGQYNHYFVEHQKMVGPSKIAGFDLYDLGSYPGIIRSKTACAPVLGEVYELDEASFKAVNNLEGEGSLYDLVFTECILNGKQTIVGVYEYARAIKRFPLVESGDWKRRTSTSYVWYACYGSNINRVRLKSYIQGGYYEKTERFYEGCRNKDLWIDERDEVFDGDLYFAKESSSWGRKGVAFFDPNGNGKTKMRLYKISIDQLEDIQKQEGPSWYSKKVSLGEIDGCDVITLTSARRLPSNRPSAKYCNVVREGLLSRTGNGEKEVDAYLTEAIER